MCLALVTARQKAEQVAAKLKEMKLTDAAALVMSGMEEALYYYEFPRERWQRSRWEIRTDVCGGKVATRGRHKSSGEPKHHNQTNAKKSAKNS